jgi:hypothetical protein
MSYLTINAIRRRTWHDLGPETAAQAGCGMTVAQLQQFICFNFTPSDAQLRNLANYYGIKV